MPSAHDLDRLKAILLQKSIRFGEFKLSSGQTSDVYIDGKLTTCLAEAMPLIGRILLKVIDARGWKPLAVGGLTLGADPIAYAMARESFENTGRYIDAFVVRKEPKKHGMQRFIEGMDATSDVPVVIIDDVCSTGASTAQAIENAKAAGMNILGAVCLVDREMGAPELLKSRFGLDLGHAFTLSQLR